MPQETSSLESDLRRLRAAAPDESFLARLEACAENTWADLTPGEIRFEKRLREITPANLPPALMASLEATLRGIPFPRDEKIVIFPQPSAAAPRHRRGWWGAAAAVALTGAVTALLIPTSPGPGKIAAAPPPPPTRVTQPAATNPADLIPAGFRRGLSEARDEGVIWQSNDQPHRVRKVVYMERVTLKDPQGRTYQVEQPRVEYILVPAKID